MKKKLISINSEPDNCAGLPIASAVSMYSETLLAGVKNFSELVTTTTDKKQIKIYNTACVLFSISGLEAKLNEFISFQTMIDMEFQIPLLREIKLLEKKLSIEEKWNLLSTIFKSNRWNNSIEPFQSFNIIRSLRNELVHYKGTPYGKNEAPSKKIKGLMKILSIKSTASFIEDDCSTWIEDMLVCPKLGGWIEIKSFEFVDEMNKLWDTNPYA